MREFMERFVRLHQLVIEAFERDYGAIMERTITGDCYNRWDSPNLKLAAGSYLALYFLDHPSNPGRGQRKYLDRYVELSDCWLRAWEEAPGRAEPFAEWVVHLLLWGMERMEESGIADPERRRRVERLAAGHIERWTPEPFFWTAPNHEIWRLAVTCIAGRLFQRKDWLDTAAFCLERLLEYQTPEGFWEEGRHHGPSMSYNGVALLPLVLLAEETGNAGILNAARRLATFITRWTFPDGVRIGAFDGRVVTGPGYFGVAGAGLDVIPEGAALMRRCLAFWDRAGWLEGPHSVGPSRVGTYGMGGAAAIALDRAARVKDAVDVPLAMDVPGAVLENHSPYFNAVLRRQGSWCIALSGQLSDAPKIGQSVFRLERQNRMEIWHERASVVVGGGHNRVADEQAFFNVSVDSGHEGDDVVGTDRLELRRSRIFPRAADCGVDGAVSWLVLSFKHAAVRFEVEPRGDAIEIRYRFRCRGVRELRLMLPLVVWRGGECFVDGGKALGEHERIPVRGEVTVRTSAWDARTRIEIPRAGSTFALGLMDCASGTSTGLGEEPFRPYLRRCLLETVFTNPDGEGEGKWTVDVSAGLEHPNREEAR